MIQKTLRQQLSRLSIALVLLGPAMLSLQSAQAATRKVPPASQDLPTDRLIIKYRTGVPGAEANASLQQRTALYRTAQDVAARNGLPKGLQFERSISAGTSHLVRLERRVSRDQLQRVMQDLKASDPNIEYVEPDAIMQAQLVPNDNSVSSQWSLHPPHDWGIDVFGAWDMGVTGKGIVVAVVDSGYQPHADLPPFLPGVDLVSDVWRANDGDGRDMNALDPGNAVLAGQCGTNSPVADTPSTWHGLGMAGIIAAKTNNGFGMAGIAHGARILPVRATGRCGGYLSDVADGIIWAAGGTVAGVSANTLYPANVINLSISFTGACSATLQNAINFARSRSAVVVTAAGNQYANAATRSPGNCVGVINVAASDHDGELAYYSNYGPSITITAPGGDVSETESYGLLSTTRSAAGSDAFNNTDGTSNAAAVVSGVLALMLEGNPTMSTEDIVAALRKTTHETLDYCQELGCGMGLINANDAVRGVRSPPYYVETEPNDSVARASQTVTAPGILQGTMGTSTDWDFFRVSVGAGKTLKATLQPNANSDYDLYVYSDPMTLVGYSANASGMSDYVFVPNTSSTAKTYYVGVRYYSGTFGPNGSYKLFLQQ